VLDVLLIQPGIYYHEFKQLVISTNLIIYYL